LKRRQFEKMLMPVKTLAMRRPLALLLALLTGVVSCSKEPGAQNRSAQADEIRGEPINSPASINANTTPVSAPAPAANPSAQPEKSVAVAAVPPTAPSPHAAAGAKENPGEPLNVGFDKLASFTYEMPDDLGSTNQVVNEKSASQIPKEIRALDQKSIALKGFMLPLKVEGGLVTELLIMRDQSMCCYGAVPKITEWVSVKMSGKGVKPVMDQPITMFGRLRVGEMRENGYLVGIYAMDGEKMAGPLDL
jgi:hypothetical protein